MPLTEDQINELKGKTPEELAQLLSEKEDELDVLAGEASLSKEEREELDKLRSLSQKSEEKHPEEKPDDKIAEALLGRLSALERSDALREIAKTYPDVPVNKLKATDPVKLAEEAKELNDIIQEKLKAVEEANAAAGKDDILGKFSGLSTPNAEVVGAKTVEEKFAKITSTAKTPREAVAGLCQQAALSIFTGDGLGKGPEK